MKPRELIDRHVAAMNAKDLDAVAALFHPDAVYIDRRPLAWERLEGREAIRVFFGSVFPYMESIASDLLAESDDRVVVRQQAIVSFDEKEGGGSGEVEMYLCVDVLAGLIGRAVVFADESSALASFEAPGDEARASE